MLINKALAKKIAVRFLMLTLVVLPAFALASPHSAICLASSFVGSAISADGKMRASETIGSSERIRFAEYVIEGRSRIEEKLWSKKSEPQILFLDGRKVFGLFDYNKYGSASALPNKTCLLIGPNGANVDVVAHELVHADIANIIGYWDNFNLSSWINEGVAMQVDFRKRYDFHELMGIDPKYVVSINGGEFYKGDSVTQNYAAAKHIIGKWIKTNGADQLVRVIQSEQAALLLTQ